MSLRFIEFDFPRDLEVSFLLLSKRQHRISHQQETAFESHRAFCASHPYRYWYLIYDQVDAIGSLYITFQNAVGINLIKDCEDWYLTVLDFALQNHTPMPAQASVTPAYFYANVAEGNHVFESALIKRQAAKIQTSYKL